MSEVSEIKSKIDSIKDGEAKVNEEIRELLLGVPNVPNEHTPVGKDKKKINYRYNATGTGVLGTYDAYSQLVFSVFLPVIPFVFFLSKSLERGLLNACSKALEEK